MNGTIEIALERIQRDIAANSRRQNRGEFAFCVSRHLMREHILSSRADVHGTVFMCYLDNRFKAMINVPLHIATLLREQSHSEMKECVVNFFCRFYADVRLIHFKGL